MSEQMTGAQATVAQLAAQGVRTLLTIPGVHTLPICDAALDVPHLRLVHGRHEQGWLRLWDYAIPWIKWSVVLRRNSVKNN